MKIKTKPRKRSGINKQKTIMSQDYFDNYVNRISEQAAKLAKVVNKNKVLQEEINSWSDLFDE